MLGGERDVELELVVGACRLFPRGGRGDGGCGRCGSSPWSLGAMMVDGRSSIMVSSSSMMTSSGRGAGGGLFPSGLAARYGISGAKACTTAAVFSVTQRNCTQAYLSQSEELPRRFCKTSLWAPRHWKVENMSGLSVGQYQTKV